VLDHDLTRRHDERKRRIAREPLLAFYFLIFTLLSPLRLGGLISVFFFTTAA
jgi:hypothetical protein